MPRSAAQALRSMAQALSYTAQAWREAVYFQTETAHAQKYLRPSKRSS